MNQPGSAPRLDSLPPQIHGRKASWFELFFDLVFVVAVAQLSESYAHHFDWVGAASSSGLLLAMWWCWLGHTFHATRFDQQRRDQRLLGLAQILTVTLIAYGVSDAFGARGEAFALGLAIFKVLLAMAYLQERRWRGAHGLIRAYTALYGLQALLWLISAVSPPLPRISLWLAALGLDLISPWWVARYTPAVQPHAEHLPERFGLFTIILLGEGVASAVHALDHGTMIHFHSMAAALAGLGLIFLTWLGYFEVTRSHGERRVENTAAGRSLRKWAYGHVPIYVGVFNLAAGTVAMASDPNWATPQLLLYGFGIALILLGLWWLHCISTEQD